MKKNVASGQGADQKDFIKIFQELCYSRQPWEVWADVITVMACSIANAADRTEPRHESREKEYAACIKRLKGVDKPAQLFAILVDALERNPDQDFLGALYMTLDLGNHWKGQFFTPYTISQMMAEITAGDFQGQIEDRGWISVCDPCIGGGAMLIAAANTIRRQKVNYQQHVMFVGQDVDRVVGMMAYVQLSLLGCPGYIVIANSLTNPVIGSPLQPAEQEGQEFWYTPLYFSQVWHYRRLYASLDAIFGEWEGQKVEDQSALLQPSGWFIFDFNDEKQGGYKVG